MNPEEILPRARQENCTILTEIEAKQLLIQVGINCTDMRLASAKDGSVGGRRHRSLSCID
jgi:hypothetical protein